jgi:hypothetical protein
MGRPMLIGQKEEAMRPAKVWSAQRFGGASGADISYKLQKILDDIEEHGNASLTRLTVLKKWFEIPSRPRHSAYSLLAGQPRRQAERRRRHRSFFVRRTTF